MDAFGDRHHTATARIINCWRISFLNAGQSFETRVAILGDQFLDQDSMV
jgi:hypothetical protein